MDPTWSDVLPQLVIAVSAAVNVFIDFGLLYLTFVSKTLQKSSNLTLFYFRFLIDGLFGLGVLITMIPFFSSVFQLMKTPNQYFLFFLSLPPVHIALLRAFLVIIITLDRTLAVFFPVSYRAYRSSMSSKFLICLVLCWPIVDQVVLWGVCEFRLKFPPGCNVFGCLANECFLKYTMMYEVTAHSIIVLTCLALAVKLFFWNRYKKSTKSKDLERANHLALIDALVIFVFDIIPIFFVIMVPYFTRKIDIVMPLCKVSGYAVEGYLVYCTLKRKSTVASKTANGKSFLALSKPSQTITKVG